MSDPSSSRMRADETYLNRLGLLMPGSHVGSVHVAAPALLGVSV